MKVVDHTARVRELAQSALEALSSVEASRAQMNQPDATRGTLRALRELYQLRRYARLSAPAVLPEATLLYCPRKDEPAVYSSRRGNESWDFRPWLAQKVSFAEQNVYALCELLEPLKSPERRLWQGAPGNRDPESGATISLERARGALQEIADIVDSGELRVAQLNPNQK